MSRRRNRRNNPQRTAAPPPQPVDQQALPRPTLPSEIDKAVRLQVQETLAVRSELTLRVRFPFQSIFRNTRGVMLLGRLNVLYRMAFKLQARSSTHHGIEDFVVFRHVRLANHGAKSSHLLIGMTALLGGIGLMASDKSIAGVATSLSALATLVGVFVWSETSEEPRIEREKANRLQRSVLNQLVPPQSVRRSQSRLSTVARFRLSPM